MTAKELQEHVSMWPEGARASQVEIVGHLWHADKLPIILDHAIALHIASGLEWLIENRNGIRVFPANEAGLGWYIDDGVMPPGLVGRGPTLFHAIHAAIVAASKERE